MRYIFVGGTVLMLACTWQLLAQQPAEVPEPLRPVMQRKLELAKALIEGLATENYDQIEQNAQALSLLSRESGWNVLVTEEYLKQGETFRRALASMREAAKEKNVDRAALGYVDMTIRCVECHKYVRKNKGNAVD
ncbi:MAG: hypothetical protein KDB22_12565 [Planctomycetales bacterium]|nr:hypothetical protein [Planctomycetales bacterium]